MSGHPPRANRDGPVSKLTSILLATCLLGATQPASATQPADAQEKAGARCPRTLDLVRDKQGFLESRHAPVSANPGRWRKFTVAGEVKSPGNYPLGGATTLLQAIARAGGVEGGSSEAVIYRTIDQKRVAENVDLARVAAGKVTDPLIRAGDVVVIGQERGCLAGLQTAGSSSAPLKPGALGLGGGSTAVPEFALVGVGAVTVADALSRHGKPCPPGHGPGDNGNGCPVSK